MSGVLVNADNFARAESDKMFAAIQAQAGGVNQWYHYRAPTPVDKQTVIRMNRDTLYSGAIVDISAGAAITIPDPGRRYLSVMVVNQDHYINKVFHEPGKHNLDTGEFGTPHVLVTTRPTQKAISALRSRWVTGVWSAAGERGAARLTSSSWAWSAGTGR